MSLAKTGESFHKPFSLAFAIVIQMAFDFHYGLEGALAHCAYQVTTGSLPATPSQ